MGRRIGAEFLGENKCRFTVWAPFAKEVDLVIKGGGENLPLTQVEKGYWSSTLSGISADTQYKICLDKDKTLPDPASGFQPNGVHSWSQVTDPQSYNWKDNDWKGLPISSMVIYELHVGTFTPEGTFEGLNKKLDYLQDLGINTIEIMPISQFPGNRNWGYDGVYPFAVQRSYGKPEALKRLIDSCHKRGIAVILDVVYNHLGPEGNYLQEYGPYFTEKYETPWGKALNFDDKHSDEVRNFFLQNALRWLREFHFDGLRLDAIHEIIDRGATHFLRELSEATKKLQKETQRSFVLIAESDLNDRRIVNPISKEGFGLQGQWVDDFHHSVHTLLTGEKEGYYSDFGRISHLAKSFEQGFVYDGMYSKFRKRTVGNSPQGISPSRFVVCIQNHDQVGNRMLGERLSRLLDFERLKLAAGLLLINPFTPMLFMGEEFGETNNFQYFVSHGDPELVKAVQKGRKREFEYFLEREESTFPDPQEEDTFNNSKLDWNFSEDSSKTHMLEFYKHLIHLRKKGDFQILRERAFHLETSESKGVMKITARRGKNLFFAFFNFSQEPQRTCLPENDFNWKIIVDSSAKRWGGIQHDSPHPESEIESAPSSFVILTTTGGVE